jgi:RecB family exonuclease
MTEERLEETTDAVDVWSVSALKTIGSCGRQYLYRYLQDAAKPEGTPPMAFGSAVHKTIEILHKEDNHWEPSQWQRLWNNIWYEYASTVEWGFYRKSPYDKLGPEMIANYIDQHRDAEILEIEYRFPQDDQVYKIGEFAIKGIVDQVRRQKNGRLLVVDLKTSKDKPDPLLLRADPQFTLYWSCIREKYGEDVDLAWLHLRTGELLRTKRTDKDLLMVEGMLREAQYKVDNSMFARNIGYGCKFCPFITDCLGGLDK